MGGDTGMALPRGDARSPVPLLCSLGVKLPFEIRPPKQTRTLRWWTKPLSCNSSRDPCAGRSSNGAAPMAAPGTSSRVQGPPAEVTCTS